MMLILRYEFGIILKSGKGVEFASYLPKVADHLKEHIRNNRIL